MVVFWIAVFARYYWPILIHYEWNSNLLMAFGNSEYLTLLLGILILVATLIFVWFGVARFNQMRLERKFKKLRAELLRDLHDEMGSKLAVINMYGALLSNEINSESTNSGDAAPYLEKLLSVTKDLYLRLQDIQWMLDPGKDKLADLFHELEAFALELLPMSNTNFEIQLNINDELLEEKLPIFHKKHMLFLFKEAIHNTAQHASASQAQLKGWTRNGTLFVLLTDDGDNQYLNAEFKEGYGLQNMEDRAEQIGADLEVNITKSGTQIKLIWPLEALHKGNRIRHFNDKL